MIAIGWYEWRGEGGRVERAYRRDRRHRTTSPRWESKSSPLINTDDTDLINAEGSEVYAKLG
jgi:hypothetical protein